MFEWLVWLMAKVTFVIGQRSQINRMLEWARFQILFGRTSRVVDSRMTDVAVCAYHLTAAAKVLAVMTTETSGSMKMSYVIRMSLPIGVHLRKEERLVDILNLRDRGLDRILLLSEHVRIFCSVKLI